jgi:hypothetical protein
LVTAVHAESPCSGLGLKVGHDIVVEVAGRPFVVEEELPPKGSTPNFLALIRSSEDKPLILTVYNTTTRTEREVTILPGRHWHAASGKQDGGLLGMQIKFMGNCVPDKRDDDTIPTHNHDDSTVPGGEGRELSRSAYQVQIIHADSPASGLGLEAEEDFIVAADGREFSVREETGAVPGLIAMIRLHEDRPLALTVHHVPSRKDRDIIIIPTKRWHDDSHSNRGLLGMKIQFREKCVPECRRDGRQEVEAGGDGDAVWDDTTIASHAQHGLMGDSIDNSTGVAMDMGMGLSGAESMPIAPTRLASLPKQQMVIPDGQMPAMPDGDNPFSFLNAVRSKNVQLLLSMVPVEDTKEVQAAKRLQVITPSLTSLFLPCTCQLPCTSVNFLRHSPLTPPPTPPCHPNPAAAAQAMLRGWRERHVLMAGYGRNKYVRSSLP